MSQTDSRQVLQVVDFNQAASFFKNNSSEEYKVQGPALNMPLSVTPLHASSSDARRTAKAKFQEVLKYRVSEDPTGDLADTGVREWSLDDFEYICTLGSGATATVYRAREKISGYEIALKVQEYDDHDTAADVELDIHSNLDHPNTVKLIDYFFSDVPFEEPCCSDDGDDDEGDMDIQNQYFCMILEICDKGSLFDVIESYEGGWLDEVDAARYMKGCLRALKYLHENDLIHCDVKTANFLVDSNDQIKLADFGMTVRKNEIEVLGGSPVFMAPEHLLAWRCGGENFDHRVDIYGLGVTLFQILVGDFPFYVIQNDEDNKNADSLLACFGKLTMGDGPIGFNPSRLDLRPLYTDSAKSPLFMPTISFPDQMSEEARDLIRKLMEPNPENRISISDALNHPWFQCVM
jgi:serine/threonine protein kinase